MQCTLFSELSPILPTSNLQAETQAADGRTESTGTKTEEVGGTVFLSVANSSSKRSIIQEEQPKIRRSPTIILPTESSSPTIVIINEALSPNTPVVSPIEQYPNVRLGVPRSRACHNLNDPDQRRMNSHITGNTPRSPFSPDEFEVLQENQVPLKSKKEVSFKEDVEVIGKTKQSPK